MDMHDILSTWTTRCSRPTPRARTSAPSATTPCATARRACASRRPTCASRMTTAPDVCPSARSSASRTATRPPPQKRLKRVTRSKTARTDRHGDPHRRGKDGDWDAVAADIRAMRAACTGKILKVIIETCLLTDDEKRALPHRRRLRRGLHQNLHRLLAQRRNVRRRAADGRTSRRDCASRRRAASRRSRTPNGSSRSARTVSAPAAS